VLSLAAAALAAGFGAPSSPAGNSGGFSAVVTGGALLIIAAMSPFTLLRLVPAFEAGAAAHLESARHRMQSVPMTLRRNGNLALDVLRQGKGTGEQTAMSALSSGESMSEPAPLPPMRTQGTAGRGDLPKDGGAAGDGGDGGQGDGANWSDLLNQGVFRPEGSVANRPGTDRPGTDRAGTDRPGGRVDDGNGGGDEPQDTAPSELPSARLVGDGGD
jgi:hypothetical protein